MISSDNEEYKIKFYKKAEENYQEILKNHKIYEKQKNARRR
jgi:hypothetical protein